MDHFERGKLLRLFQRKGDFKGMSCIAHTSLFIQISNVTDDDIHHNWK